MYEAIGRVAAALGSAGRLQILVEKLRKRGFKAKRLENGFPEWRAAGLPVER